MWKGTQPSVVRSLKPPAMAEPAQRCGHTSPAGRPCTLLPLGQMGDRLRNTSPSTSVALTWVRAPFAVKRS